MSTLGKNLTSIFELALGVHRRSFGLVKKDFPVAHLENFRILFFRGYELISIHLFL